MKTAEELEQQRAREEAPPKGRRIEFDDGRHAEPKPNPVGYVDMPNACSNIRVAVGKESFFPIKFQGFDVGPVEVTVELRPGETPHAAYERAKELADEFFMQEFETKCSGFAERVKKARLSAGE